MRDMSLPMCAQKIVLYNFTRTFIRTRQHFHSTKLIDVENVIMLAVTLAKTDRGSLFVASFYISLSLAKIL